VSIFGHKSSILCPNMDILISSLGQIFVVSALVHTKLGVLFHLGELCVCALGEGLQNSYNLTIDPGLMLSSDSGGHVTTHM